MLRPANDDLAASIPTCIFSLDINKDSLVPFSESKQDRPQVSPRELDLRAGGARTGEPGRGAELLQRGAGLAREWGG